MESIAKSLVARLAKCGVSKVFSIPGGASSGIEVELHKHPTIEHIVCQHEATAGYMAMGHHLATGEIGVLVVTSGPGALNATAPIAAAKADELPLLAIAGDVSRSNANRGALQDGGWSGLDMVNVMRPLARLALRVDHPSQTLVRLEQALNRCQQHPRGPAFLSVPIDIQTSHAASQSVDFPLAPLPKLEEPALNQICELWAKSKSPTIMVGIGCKRMELDAEIRDLSEYTSTPVLADAEGLGVVPRRNPLFVAMYGVGDTGAGRRWLTRKKTDLIIAIGCRFDDATTAGFSEDIGSIPLVQLDYDRRRLGRAFATKVASHCDLKDALDRIRTHLPKGSKEKRDETIAQIRSIKRYPHRPMPFLTAAPHDPRSVVEALQRHFGDATFFSDIGNHLLATLGYLEVKHSRHFHFSQGIGGMGSGIGMGIGCSASKRTLSICGDGGTLMSGNELFTAVKYNWPVNFVVFVDGELGMVVDGIKRVYAAKPNYSIERFDVAGWATSLGCRSVTVNTEIDLVNAAAYCEGPQVIVVPISKNVVFTNPREEVINFSSTKEWEVHGKK